MTRDRWRLLAVVVALVSATATAAAQNATIPGGPPEDARLGESPGTPGLAIDEPVAVLAYVLGSLPPRVTVYPTGNYFYFRFVHDGRRFAGNIRLHALDRDSGKLHFAYYAEADPARRATGDPEPARNALGGTFDASHGVTVERLGPLVYRVDCGGSRVVFELNDLSRVRPPAAALAPDERFVGPIMDESGIRFFLVYNARLRAFHYVLDETAPVPEAFVPSQLTDRIVIGGRTGFAFYRDVDLDRRILIGVLDANRWANNAFDGPFDQLPDNFIEGEALREIILDIEPGLEGRIDRLGYSLDYTSRYTIDPYIHYGSEADLHAVHLCVIGARFAATPHARCYAEEGGRSRAAAQPDR